MANKVYSCNEAINYLKSVYGSSDIVYLTLSTKCQEQAGYQELVTLLDAGNLTNGLREGYYLIEPDTDTPQGQKVHLSFVTPIVIDNGEEGGETVEVTNLVPDIIVTVDIKANETITFSDFWEMNDNSDGGFARGVIWENNGVLEDSLTHTFEEDYVGKIHIYNYSIRKGLPVAADAGGRQRITNIEFVKPQVVEDGRFLFANMIALQTVTGTVCFSETYEVAGVAQMFYNCFALTSLKGYTIIASSERPTYLSTFFINSSLDDKMLQEIKIIGLNKDNVLSYQQTFSNTKITHVNNKFVGKGAKSFEYAFEGCPVTYLPSGVLDNCINGHRAFSTSSLSGVSPSATLKSLQYGDEMFSACPMTYTLSKHLYDTLPQVTGATMQTNRDANNQYTIVFGCIPGEEAKIAKLFGIPKDNPNTSAPWNGGYGIPKAEQAQYWLSPKGWYVSFSDN